MSVSACASARRSRGWSCAARTTRARRTRSASGSSPARRSGSRSTGRPWTGCTDVGARPLVSVFLPDRLELVTGAPALRRAHLDQVVAALRPARAGTRRAYSAALGQRNALVAAIRAGRAGRSSLPAWDAELARHGMALMTDRAAVVDDLRPRVRRPRRAAGPRRQPGDRVPAALAARRRRRSWLRSSPSGPTPTSSAGSPATARIATISPCAATAASYAPTGRAASSGSACWRCSSPSARCWPRSAARLP